MKEWTNGGLDPVLGVERTALADRLHARQLEADALRGELDATRASLEATQRKLEAIEARHTDTQTRLRRAYASHLWKLGGFFDRARHRINRTLPATKR